MYFVGIDDLYSLFKFEYFCKNIKLKTFQLRGSKSDDKNCVYHLLD